MSYRDFSRCQGLLSFISWVVDFQGLWLLTEIYISQTEEVVEGVCLHGGIRGRGLRQKPVTLTNVNQKNKAERGQTFPQTAGLRRYSQRRVCFCAQSGHSQQRRSSFSCQCRNFISGENWQAPRVPTMHSARPTPSHCAPWLPESTRTPEGGPFCAG